MSWMEFLPHVRDRLRGFLLTRIHDCARHIMAQVRVLAPTFLLERLTAVKDQQYLDGVAQMEPQVKVLAQQYADSLEIDFPAADGDK